MQSFFQFRELRAVSQKQVNADKQQQESSRLRRTLRRSQTTSSRGSNGLPSRTGQTRVANIGEVELKHLEKRDDNEHEDQGQDGEALPTEKKFIVTPAAVDDPADAKNWPYNNRMRVVIVLWLLVFSFGWASSCDSNTIKPAAEEFGVSEEAATLATSLFFVGLSIGSLFAGPLSESFGRNLTYLISGAMFICFSLGSALAPNLGALLAFRFLAGVASSPTLSVYGGTLADMFEGDERIQVWAIFATGPVLGPVLSPLASAWMIEYISPRWPYWVSLIFCSVTFIIALLFLPETFGPILENWKAQHLRSLTSDDRYISKFEARAPFAVLLKDNLLRPARFFTAEPIIIFLGLYLVIIYVINFSFLNGFSTIFESTYNLSDGITGFAFVSVTAGALFNVALTPFYRWLHRYLLDHHYSKPTPSSSEIELEKVNSSPLLQRLGGPPELRIAAAAIAAPFLPISLFWLGWTNYPSISPLSGFFATALFGYSLTAIFVSSYAYIIVSYGPASSSALGSITVVRYLASAGILVITRPMYDNLGVQWTLTMLGCFGVVMIPVPLVLWRWGKWIRARSAFASAEG